MNFDEAMSEAVQGARVTCDYLGAGVYVDYQFSGWRINQPNGMASSGFGFRDEHKAQEWRIVCNEHSWVEGAEGAFAGFTHHCSLCGVEGNPEVPKPKPNVWGRPRIALGEAGVPEGSTLYASTKGGGKSYSGNINRDFGKMAAPAKPSNVGTAAPLSGLALARLERAKAAEPLPTPDKPARPWGAPAAKPWGPGK